MVARVILNIQKQILDSPRVRDSRGQLYLFNKLIGCFSDVSSGRAVATGPVGTVFSPV